MIAIFKYKTFYIAFPKLLMLNTKHIKIEKQIN